MKSSIATSEQGITAKSATVVPFRWALVCLSLAMLLSSLGTSIANVGLPTFAQAFAATFQQVQWVVLAYLLAITMLIVSVGRLGDAIGRRRLMLGGITLFTAASVLCGYAPTLWLLISARAVQGLGAAIMMALAMAMIGDSVPKERTGSAMGLLGTMSAIGTALGPTLGGTLIAGFGWPALFLVNLPLGILTLALAYRHLPADKNHLTFAPVSFDVFGTVLLVFTLAAYALAMTLGHGNFGQLNVILLLMALVGLGLFVLVELKSESPLIQMANFRVPALGAGFAMSALVTTVVMATLVVGPFYLSGSLGLDPAGVGFVMSSGPLVAALTGAPAGRYVDRFGAFRVGIYGLLGMLVGTSLLVLIPAGYGIAGYVAPLVVITGGYAMFQAANNTAVMANVQANQRGVISGLLNLSRNLGLITGASLMGAVFAMGAGTSKFSAATPESVLSGMRITFAVAAGLIAMALTILFASRARASATHI